ncbi:DUF2225 domain-containing protein [Defluviitalea phaphyphila]|uniref:DUF2225 domain-containing protein n=1 Tax=Defluviitalea phaphyphila TaxID=1473580 RepID=UPI00072FCF2C|nr:DUF2225 domain-containing protein [Defluviitalea phaphyphila]
MNLEEYLYEKNVECPVCGNKFKAIEVKQKAYVVDYRDSDFCVHYKNINPLLYDVWICQLCGYASLKRTFSDMSFKRAELIKKYITTKWVAKESEKVIDYESAIKRFKLALISAQISKAKASEIASICLKIAWIYRFMDNVENEKQFLQYAIDKYTEAYLQESFPVENLDKTTAEYLIGELNRRVGNLEEAVTWFNKVMSDRTASERIMKLCREQWNIVREKLKINE